MCTIKKEYDTLVEKYYLSLFRFLYGLCGNKEDAEDIVQNSYLKLWNSDMEFNSIEHAKNWLYKVAVNNMRDIKTSKWKNVELRDEYDDIPFEDNETLELFEAVQALDGNYKIVILLYYYEGYSIKEMSDLLGVKESTIATRLQRARKKLHIKLEEEYGK